MPGSIVSAATVADMQTMDTSGMSAGSLTYVINTATYFTYDPTSLAAVSAGLVYYTANVLATNEPTNTAGRWVRAIPVSVVASPIVSAFATSSADVPIGAAPAWTDVITTNITTTAEGYLYASAFTLWHPHASAATNVEFQLVLGAETSDITVQEDRGIMISTPIMYRSIATVVAGTYAITLRARLISGSASEVHHVDMVAMGNLQ